MDKAQEGDVIVLARQEVRVIKCKKCDHLMVNIDADQLALGDLRILKNAGVRVSNPETEQEICSNCEFESFGSKLSRWFEDDNDDDDSSFFGGGGIFGGSMGGGFGGFGGGGFSGGGAARGF